VIVGEKVIALVIKAVAKKFKLDKILKYVEEPNELDKRVELLEKMAHPPKDFVICEECHKTIKDKKWYEN
jgi:hypothetical protein